MFLIECRDQPVSYLALDLSNQSLGVGGYCCSGTWRHGLGPNDLLGVCGDSCQGTLRDVLGQSNLSGCWKLFLLRRVLGLQ